MSELQGMKEICSHVNRSEATVLAMIRQEGFPATKIGGGWVSDTDLINEWRRRIICSRVKLDKPGQDTGYPA